MLGIGLKLLGIGKAILGFLLGLFKAIAEFAQKRPLLALAIAVDLVLVYGCWWGYQRHNDALRANVQIVQLHKDIKEKDTLIEQLYGRLKDYALALREAHDDQIKTINQNNEAIEQLKGEADKQLARAQAEAAKTKAQRDYYFKLAEHYRRNTSKCGTEAVARIKCEETLNGQFIRDYQRGRS